MIMEKFNKIKKTDKFNYLLSLFENINVLYEKLGDISIVSDIHYNLQEFAGYEYMEAFRFYKRFEVIRDYCDKFFDCNENGFSYQLGCKYQHIDFDFESNIKAEIDWLKGLLKIYNPKFKQEISIIENLIKDLEDFKPIFSDYFNS